MNAICVDTPGSFDCYCNEGFAGDGFTCLGLSIIIAIIIYQQLLGLEIVTTSQTSMNAREREAVQKMQSVQIPQAVLFAHAMRATLVMASVLV